jgi:hypothetical protein
MNQYIITLIQGSTRTVRKVIAHSSMQATLIGIRMMPETHSPVSIFCKPAERNLA